ncbi:hypothetical protein UA08_06981 [Talaromyces atroroseus]|uniref:Zn(2)-C6 fungal-type domain-containing protein n=1 Tax=Talaromyces atroroseus TaxID=1441469 RepID=A0A225ABH1_TALAT|nr:hypothetical protein UA08_06981 [Talaromyces atroroseus]OKL57640.1 hypothetical protein UA08_06981 [Talaromyces atroroseus]
MEQELSSSSSSSSSTMSEKSAHRNKRGGIPYTSLGCATCKKRKIKCDLGKPECARCTKKGTPCPGYEKNRNFLHHMVVSRCASNGETRKRPVRQLVGYLKPLALPTGFNMNAEVRTQLFSTFMDTFFAPDTSSLSGDDDTWYLLMTRFPALASESDLLDRAVIALVSLFLGKKTGDVRLGRHGTEIYSSALNVMARMLQRGCPPTLDMLYVGIVFHTYETLSSNGNTFRNCLTHIQGATAILKHYDYNTHEDKVLIKAILNRQKWAVACFLTSTQYGPEVDWECLTLRFEEDPMDQLFEVIAECAILQRDLNSIVKLQTPLNMEEDPCEALLQRCYKLEKKLQIDWLNGPAAHKLSGRPSPCRRDRLSYEPSALPLDSDVDPYEFENLGTAKAYILFWIASAVTRRVIHRCEKLLLSREPNPTRMLFYAGEICRSMAYCLQPSTRMSTGHTVMFSIAQASKCYVDCGDKESFMWCQGIYPLISSRGFDIARHMSRAEWKFWNAFQNQLMPVSRLPLEPADEEYIDANYDI